MYWLSPQLCRQLDSLLLDNPNFDLSSINVSMFDRLFHQSLNRHDSIIRTSDADLGYFKQRSSKLIDWYGLPDSLISPNTTVNYAQRVYEHDSDAAYYYRFFEAPGVDHCGGGSGWFPGNGLQCLIDWVEKDIVSDILDAKIEGEASGELHTSACGRGVCPCQL